MTIKQSQRFSPHMRLHDTETRKANSTINAVNVAIELADKLKSARNALECAKLSLAKAANRRSKHALRAKVFYLTKQVESY